MILSPVADIGVRTTAPIIASVPTKIGSPISAQPRLGVASAPISATINTTTETAVKAYLARFSIPFDPNDKWAATYQTIANNNVPPSAPSDIRTTIESCLRARGILYYKSKPGDCTLPTAVRGPSTLTTGVQISEASLGSVSALGQAGLIALGAAAAPLAIATVGIGLIAAPLMIMQAHHAAAVQTEQQTICSVAEMVNQTIPNVDNAVRNGAISPSDANNLMQIICQNGMQGLDTIKKVCNAACVYEACLRAHMDFAKIFYPAISPVTNQHPVAPATPSPQAPASAPSGLASAPSYDVSKPPFNPVQTAVYPSSAPTATNKIGGLTGYAAPSTVTPAVGTAGMPIFSQKLEITPWELIIIAGVVIAGFYLIPRK